MSEMRSARYPGADLSENEAQPIGGVSLPSVSYGLQPVHRNDFPENPPHAHASGFADARHL